MKKKPGKNIVTILIVFLLFVVLDYVNILNLIGLNFTNLNMDVVGILFDAVIVLILYVISFYYIENKQNEKDANARDTAEALMKKTYQECWENVMLLDNKAMIRKYIIPKMDGDKPNSENMVVNNLQILPFSSFDVVMELAVNGHIGKKNLDDYLEIKKEYQSVVGLKITFYDLVEPKTEEQSAMLLYIEQRDKELKRKLEELR